MKFLASVCDNVAMILSLQPLQNKTVREGDRVVLECVVPPYPAPETVQWACNGVPINDSPDYRVTYSNGRCSLTIAEVFPEDSGTFSCTVTVNAASNVTTLYLRVEGQSRILHILFDEKVSIVNLWMITDSCKDYWTMK